MPDEEPQVVVLAGPNGAGKTTAAPFILHDSMGIEHFINADDIARGLSAFAPEHVAFTAGRIMLEHIHTMIHQHLSFAFETTLSTRSYAHLLSEMKQHGYAVYLIFLYLDSPKLAIDRVHERIRQGGHAIPDDVIYRRYYRGLWNLFHLYMPIVNQWVVYHNADQQQNIIASGNATHLSIINHTLWNRMKEQIHE